MADGPSLDAWLRDTIEVKGILTPIHGWRIGRMAMAKYKYDIAFSYASEDCEITDTVYHYLRANGLKLCIAHAHFAHPFL